MTIFLILFIALAPFVWIIRTRSYRSARTHEGFIALYYASLIGHIMMYALITGATTPWLAISVLVIGILVQLRITFSIPKEPVTPEPSSKSSPAPSDPPA